MRTRELVRWLKEQGYWHVPGKSRHELYTNGTVRLYIGRHDRLTVRSVRNVMSQVRNNQQRVTTNANLGTDQKEYRRQIRQKEA